MPRIFLASISLLITAQPVFAAGDANPFAGRIYQAIAAVAVFAVVFIVLKTKAWGPILKGLQDRENKIKGDLESAERLNKDAQANLKAYQAQLNDAAASAKQILDQARADADRLRAQRHAETQAEITAMRTQVTRDIQNAKDQAVKQLIEEVGTISTQIAAQILKREINASDNAQIVRDTIADFTSKN